MTWSPLVSVIVPFFDSEQYLAEALDSVVAQTYRPVELLLVDDGSTDASAAIAARYVPPARSLSRENGGPGAARNSALAVAAGELLAFCDADDWWEPEKLALQVGALDARPDVDVVFTYLGEFVSPEIDPAGSMLRPSIARRPGVSPSAMLVRRDVFDRVGTFDEQYRVGEWADWWARAQACGVTTLTLDALLVHRRLHDTNNTHRGDQRRDYLHAARRAIGRRRAAGAAG